MEKNCAEMLELKDRQGMPDATDVVPRTCSVRRRTLEQRAVQHHAPSLIDDGGARGSSRSTFSREDGSAIDASEPSRDWQISISKMMAPVSSGRALGLRMGVTDGPPGPPTDVFDSPQTGSREMAGGRKTVRLTRRAPRLQSRGGVACS